tara:strand:+ start:750 stop:1325 length:576 start_codon:yes stop_codon:yes gene_type:complete
MKRIIQLILFLSLIVISLIFHRIYFQNDDKIDIQGSIPTNESFDSSINNLIKDLKYEVKLDNDSEYTITAEVGEIFYENDAEKVYMQMVIATLIDQNRLPVTIKSNKALYDNSNYGTNFSENVRIEYGNEIILSDKVDLDFKSNIISIYENVIYNGINGSMKADNITINLITKKINVNMNNKKDNVKIIVN